MKRVIILVVLLLATVSGYAQGNERGVSNGISSGDKAQILLACMNHSGFANYYAANGNVAVNIVDLPGDVQFSSGATALGHSISLATGEEARNGSVSNYFTIGKVSADGQVSLNYFYNHSNQGYKVVMVEMEVNNSGGQYQIVNSNYTGDTL